MDFVIGGLAGAIACFFSNPLDVVKTRMQLQGELKAAGKHSVHYRNIPHAIYNIVKHDGVLALQQGLIPALWFQWVLNSVKLGLYQVADNQGLLRDVHGKTKFVNGLGFGAFSGMCAGFFGSPFQLVKIQLMSHSSKQIAVGTQHSHLGMTHAIKKIVQSSGVNGLWRGAHGMMIGNAIGSASQLAFFVMSKEWMDSNNMFQQSAYGTSFVASNFGAIAKTVAINPLDVIMTRLYNQGVNKEGHGLLYSGIIDCAWKITTTEGLLAFFKGIGPNYLRQGPQTILLLVFWDILKDTRKNYEIGKLRKEVEIRNSLFTSAKDA